MKNSVQIEESTVEDIGISEFVPIPVITLGVRPCYCLDDLSISQNYTNIRERNFSNLNNVPLERTFNINGLTKFSLWNARSWSKKIAYICDFIISSRIDILCMTETWVTDNESHSISTLTNSLQDYQIICLSS